jgi:hypothetical protein
MGAITSADAVLMLSSPLLFPTPQQIQGFATDDIYDIPSIKSVEVLMGVDGVLSAGFVYVQVPQTISLQADSLSNRFFQTIWTQMQAAKSGYAINGVIRLPSISTKFTQVNGYLTGYKPAPSAKKLLQACVYEITWESISPSPT